MRPIFLVLLLAIAGPLLILGVADLIGRSNGYPDELTQAVLLASASLFSACFAIVGFCISRRGIRTSSPRLGTRPTLITSIVVVLLNTTFLAAGFRSENHSFGEGDGTGPELVQNVQNWWHYPYSHQFVYVDGDQELFTLNADGPGEFYDGRAVVRVGEKTGTIDIAGNWVVPPKYERVGPFYEDGLLAVRLNELWGYIDTEGTTVIPHQFEQVRMFSDELVAVQLNSAWGYIDRAGEFQIPAEFDDAYSFSEGLAVVAVEELYGYIDINGSFVIPPNYAFALPWGDDGFGSVLIHCDMYPIDRNGKLGEPEPACP